LFSGIDDSVLNIIRPELESYGLYPLRGGSGGRITPPKGASRELNPGDAVGIQVISGDMTATPVGTVTYRRGNQLLMFGHPNFFRGPVNLPMTKEYIHTVIANQEVSFKLSSTMFEVGRVYEDRKAAVAGELGKYVRKVPVRVAIKSDSSTETFHFEVVKDPLFFPNLLSTCILQSVLNVNSKIANNSVELEFKIKVKNTATGEIKTVTTNDFMTGNVTEKNMFQGLFRLTLPLQAIMYNPFVKAEILDIKVNLKISRGWLASELLDAKLLKNEVHEGDDLPVLVTLRTFQGKIIYKKLSIKLPDVIQTSVVSLGVGSAKVEMTLDKAFSLSRFVPNNFNHLISILNRNERFNDLVIWVDVPERGLMIKGQEHPDLPSSMQSVMSRGAGKGSVIKGRVRKYYRSNYLIYGMKVLPVTILSRESK
ncbi:MAG: hypothetical protein OEZ36_08100, partial [Spirochaetota bacterium]|nr:hypothetical protein [Spirochaetota bacterium]